MRSVRDVTSCLWGMTAGTGLAGFSADPATRH